MTAADDIAFVGQLLDAYAVDDCRMGVASQSPKDAGVPPEMQVGDVNDEGWGEWRVLQSTLTEAEVIAVEKEFGVEFPPLFRAYLLARFQLFDQVWSRRYDQLICMTDTPAREPLKPLRQLMTAWRPLVDAGYIPFSEWGDGWGPMCFDSPGRGADGDCPVVWMDESCSFRLDRIDVGGASPFCRWFNPSMHHVGSSSWTCSAAANQRVHARRRSRPGWWLGHSRRPRDP